MGGANARLLAISPAQVRWYLSCNHISASNIKDYILGYVPANDVSCDNVDDRDHHLARSKSADGFCPLGHYIDTEYDYLREHQIFAQVHYIPVHLNSYYKNLGWKKGYFPKAEAYYEKALSLPMYPSLKEEEQAFVIEKIKEFYL